MKYLQTVSFVTNLNPLLCDLMLCKFLSSNSAVFFRKDHNTSGLVRITSSRDVCIAKRSIWPVSSFMISADSDDEGGVEGARPAEGTDDTQPDDERTDSGSGEEKESEPENEGGEGRGGHRKKAKVKKRKKKGSQVCCY